MACLLYTSKSVAWDYLRHYSAPVPGRVVKEGELSVLLPNGAKLRLFGADNPDALRGKMCIRDRHESAGGAAEKRLRGRMRRLTEITSKHSAFSS